MKYLIGTLIPRMRLQWHLMRPHILPIALIVGVFFSLHTMARNISPGWLTYLMSTVAMGMIAVTALARLNDMPLEDYALRWQFRRAGFILMGTACISIILSPLSGNYHWPTWNEVFFRLGAAITFTTTTPGMPPWWRYITGEYKKEVIEIAEDVDLRVRRTAAPATGYGRRATDVQPDQEKAP